MEKVAFITRKDIHAGISNFIHNELKISREEIYEVMKQKIEEVADRRIKEFLNSKYFEGLVQRCIVAIIKDGVNDGFYGKTSFDKFITGEIASQVRNMVAKKYEVKVEERKES